MMRISMSLPKKLLADFDEVLKERGYRILPITEDKEAMNFWSKNL